METDILIIGGGPGGYTAAIRAAQMGFDVTLVEKAELGGVCLNWGCIPTKSLLHSADVLREIRKSDALGIQVTGMKINFEKMVERSRSVASQLNKGVHHLLRKNKVNLVLGEASIIDKNTVRVGDQSIVTDNIIIATGARPKNLPHIQVDSLKIWDAKTAMNPPFRPKSLLIIGAGAIGVEFASFYNTIDTKVTLVEVLDEILPTEDKEIAAIAHEAFSKQGINIRTSTGIDSISTKPSGIEAIIDGETHFFEAAILSVGVTGNLENLGLEALCIESTAGFIDVNSSLETSVRGIYAIGDVKGAPCLAHKATHEALTVIESILGDDAHTAPHIPGCTYSYPQIASIGLTENQAALEHDIRIGRFPLIANGKAIAIDETEGLVKTIFDKHSGELLGAHLVGAGVTELIAGFAIAIGLETTEAELINTIFAHPTVSEAMHESVLSAYDRAINF